MKNIINILFFFVSTYLFAQGGASSCAELEANPAPYQSCATSIPFENSVGGNGENFNTTCIGAPFQGPTWFFIKIQTTGNILLQISQENNQGFGTDVDFVLWGPFDTLDNICSQLTIANEVDCSWSAASIENVVLPNGIQGQFYILLVDNYSNEPGQITITQTGGSGSSDCSFLSSVDITDISNNEITEVAVCKPNTFAIKATIDVNDFPGELANLRFNYKWFRDGVLLNTIENSLINTNELLNITESGTYKVETTAYDITDPPASINDLTVSSDEVILRFHTTPQVQISTNNSCLSNNPTLSSTILNNAILTASIDALTYQWFLNGVAVVNGNNATFSPVLPGNYFLRVFNGPCNFVDSNSILIGATPQVTINSNSTFCENDFFTITSTISNSALLQNVTYQWYQNNTAIVGANTASLTVSTAIQPVSTTAVYRLEVFELGNCLGVSNTVSITINQQPIVATTPITLEQCDYITPTTDGFAIFNLNQLYDAITNATPNFTLEFSLNNTFTNLITSPENFVNTQPFSQTIFARAINNTSNPSCVSSNFSTILLVVNPTSISNYPNIAPQCPVLNQNYGLINFNAQRQLIKNTFFPLVNVTISFYANEIDAATEQNSLTNNSQIPTGTQTIFTRIETNNNCEGIGVFQVTIFQAPIRNTINTIRICENDSFSISSFDIDALANQSATVISSYHNTLLDAQNNVNPINKNASFIYPIGVTSFFIRLFDTQTGCFSIVSSNLRVFDRPNIQNPRPISICGDIQTSFNLNSRIAEIIGNNPSYQVFFFENNSQVASNTFITTPSAYLSENKTLIVKVVDPQNNNCESFTTLSLNVLSIPGATANPTPIELCDDSGFASFDLTLRNSEIQGNSISDTFIIRYYINENDAINNASTFINNITSFTNTIASFQKIYVRVTSTINFDSETQEACFRVLELDLYVRPFPPNKLQDFPYYICVDENATVIRPADVFTYLNENQYSFQWYSSFDALAGNEIIGATQNSFTINEEGNYSIKVIDISNVAQCERIFNFSTQNTLIPTLVEAIPNQVNGLESNNTIIVETMPNSPDYEYSIYPDTWQESNVFTNIPAGDYTINVRNQFGCGSISSSFVVFDFPLFFTPNGDGFNDTWKCKGTRAVNNLRILIFDRMGKLLKQLAAEGEGWDGTYNGIALPADDYWFLYEYEFNGTAKKFKGHFSLKR